MSEIEKLGLRLTRRPTGKLPKNIPVGRTYASTALRGFKRSVPWSLGFYAVGEALRPEGGKPRPPEEKMKDLGRELAVGGAGWAGWDISSQFIRRRMGKIQAPKSVPKTTPAHRRILAGQTRFSKRFRKSIAPNTERVLEAAKKKQPKPFLQRLGKGIKKFPGKLKKLPKASLPVMGALAGSIIAASAMERLLGSKKKAE